MLVSVLIGLIGLIGVRVEPNRCVGAFLVLVHSLLQLQIFEIFWRRKNSAGGARHRGGAEFLKCNRYVFVLWDPSSTTPHPTPQK